MSQSVDGKNLIVINIPGLCDGDDLKFKNKKRSEMSEEKISITRALKEIKLLSDRIDKKINSSNFVDVYQKRNQNQTLLTKKNKTEFENLAIANLQAITDLINRRNKIKSAILISNSRTVIKIAGSEYLVVEAIDRKQSIVFEKSLLNKMRHDYQTAITNIERNNVEIERRVDSMVKESMSSDSQVDSDTYNQIADPIYKTNKCEIIDPVKAEKYIDELDKKIDEFLAEVDFVLSESNSRTEITI